MKHLILINCTGIPETARFRSGRTHLVAQTAELAEANKTFLKMETDFSKAGANDNQL